MRLLFAYDGSFEILCAGPITIGNNAGPMHVTGIGIDTPKDMHHVDVDAGNGVSSFPGSQPKREPVPTILQQNVR